MKAWYLEVLDAEGAVRERRRLEGPAAVGRSYAADVILDDPWVSPVHARLSPAEGGWAVADAGSLNGVRRAEGASLLAGAVVVADGATFVVGRTTLRLRSSDFPVPEALPLAAAAPAPAGGAWPRAAAALWAALLAFVVGRMAAVHFEDIQPTRRAGAWILASAGMVLGGAAWSGLCALVSRLSSGRRAFWPHMTVTGAAALAWALAASGLGWAAFALGTGRGAWWIAAALVTGAQWTAHLRLGILPEARRALRTGFAAAAIFWGTCGAATYFFSKAFSPRPRFDAAVRPSWARLAPVLPPEAWLGRMAKLRAKADADAAKAPAP